MKTPGGGRWLVPALLALVSVSPNPAAAWPGQTYFFRDFSLTYYPLRAFFSREMAAGRWPFWNPYLHEGCAFLPVFYPLEVVHALWPGPSAVSWLLTVHFPIAALSMYALVRELGTPRLGAFVSGAAYAMGGLALSCLNLHWFLQALALTPLLALALRRAAIFGGRWIPGAGLVLALGISTLAAEFVVQGVVLGAWLAFAARRDRAAVARVALAGLVGLGVAALPVALVLGILADSVRGAGFSRALALQNALPPLTLLQLVVPDLYGSVAEPLRFWWGGRLFPSGPYFMSLYLGPLVLCCAAVGACDRTLRGRIGLVVLAAGGVWYAVGSSGGLASILAPAVPWFRFPVKAVLLPHAVAAVLAGRGVAALASAPEWRRLRPALVACGLAVAVLAALVGLAQAPLAALLDISPVASLAMRRTIMRECLQAALLVCGGLVLVAAATRTALAPARAAQVLALLLVLDVWHAGVGLNPQTAPQLFQPRALGDLHLADLDGGRVFSYGVDRSPALQQLIQARLPGLEATSFRLSRLALNPYENLIDAVETAEGRDRLSFVPHAGWVRAEEEDPSRAGEILPRLRSAAVSRVVSLDPLEHADLRLLMTSPTGLPDVALRVYELKDAWPRAHLACRVVAAPDGRKAVLAAGFDPRRDVALATPAPADCRTGEVRRRAFAPGDERYDVTSDGAGFLVMRDSFASGWRAWLDGKPTPVVRADGVYRAVAVPPGRHDVTLRYEPPGLRPGLALSAAALLAAVALMLRPVLVVR